MRGGGARRNQERRAENCKNAVNPTLTLRTKPLLYNTHPYIYTPTRQCVGGYIIAYLIPSYPQTKKENDWEIFLRVCNGTKRGRIIRILQEWDLVHRHILDLLPLSSKEVHKQQKLCSPESA